MPVGMTSIGTQIGVLPEGLRALFYLRLKATRDAKVLLLDIQFAPVHHKAEAEAQAEAMARRAKWLQMTFHEAVSAEFPALRGKGGFGIGPHFSVLAIDESDTDGEDGLPAGLADALSDLFSARGRSRTH